MDDELPVTKPVTDAAAVVVVATVYAILKPARRARRAD